MALASLKVVVTGRVQGVNFRDFTRHQAESLGLTGYARNIHGSQSVEVVAEGDRGSLEKLLEAVSKGPSRASVEGIATTWDDYRGDFKDFKIHY